MKYTVQSPIKHNGKRYGPGESIDLSPGQAEGLHVEEAESEKLKAESEKAESGKSQRDRQEASEQASTDLTAKEAVAMIESTPFEQLAGFVGEGETRKTVLTAWNSKQKETPENQQS
jgi:hypothetical protein